MYIVADVCDHVTHGSDVADLERETTLAFEVRTCSRVIVQLSTSRIQNVYQLEFAKSNVESNDVTIGPTRETIRQMSQFTQECQSTRQFWVSWKDDVISGGIGLSPGTKELVRLIDRRKGRNESVSTAHITTTPTDVVATFKTFRSECTYQPQDA